MNGSQHNQFRDRRSGKEKQGDRTWLNTFSEGQQASHLLEERQVGTEHLFEDKRRTVITQLFRFLPEAPQKTTGALSLGR